MPKQSLDARLAKFLRKQRGELSYEAFARKLSIGHMTARRLESGEHHITLRKLGVIMAKLKVRLSDVFPEEF